LNPADTASVASASTATQAPAVASTIALPNCVVSPALTEGPYFADVKLNRADIRSDPTDGSVKQGLPLQLTLQVSQVGKAGCAPLAGALVDLWHCDALGVYSDFQAEGTAGKMFLRGSQVTDASGKVQFTTIYPGWYQGRAVHIHFKVRSNADAGKSYEFTSQFFFDETITDTVHAQQPYAARGLNRLKNENDSIYQSGGSQLLLTPTQISGQGYATTFDIGLQMA
jgi:protocatechuate 3,4-dioxygenase beta subunit